jgi:signal transduction histidine kinase
VVIRLLPRSLRDGQLMSGFSIEDNGIGMAPEQLARVCERFYRADTSGKIPGTGLGMSIVKEIVELHRGTVNITSKAGNGTTVTVWLPVSNV